MSRRSAESDKEKAMIEVEQRKIRPCGHYAGERECNDCPANKLWRDEQDSWCGCAKPGRDGVLACGHCSCGYGCFEVVRGESVAAMQIVPCA